MARLVIDLPENSPRCILFSGPGVRLPASVGLGAAAGLRPIRPKRMRTRVGMLRRPAKTQGQRAERRRGLVRPLRLDPNLARVRFAARLG
jgi:hypothetical protein